MNILTWLCDNWAVVTDLLFVWGTVLLVAFIVAFQL